MNTTISVIATVSSILPRRPICGMGARITTTQSPRSLGATREGSLARTGGGRLAVADLLERGEGRVEVGHLDEGHPGLLVAQRLGAVAGGREEVARPGVL